MSHPIRCLIVDDEPLAIRLLTHHVQQIDQLTLVGSFDDPVKALNFLQKHPVDLLFLDIQMPILTGLELAQTLDKNTAVILTTAYREYAVESYELAVTDYLLKPITFPRFYRAVNRFLQSRSDTSSAKPLPKTESIASETSRFFNVNKKYVKVKLADVTYVESMKDYVRINTKSEQFVTKESISELANTLPDYFLRVHRSFLVNTKQITAYTAHDLELGAAEIPIGATYKQVVQDWLSRLP